MSNAHQRRNRAMRQDDATQAAALAQLEREGFHVDRFSDAHYRVDYYIDYWPITGRWRQMNNAFWGQGIDALIVKLREERAVKAEEKPSYAELEHRLAEALAAFEDIMRYTSCDHAAGVAYRWVEAQQQIGGSDV